MSKRIRAAHGFIIISVVLLTVFLGSHAIAMRIKVHEFDLVPEKYDHAAIEEALGARFGDQEWVIIAFESRLQSLPDEGFLQAYQAFVEELRAHPYLRVLMVDPILRPRFLPHDDPDASYFLHEPSGEWVRQAMDKSKVTRSLHVSRSRQAVFLRFPALSPAGVQAIRQTALAAGERLDERAPGAYAVRVLGQAIVLDELGEAIQNDLGRLVPWVFLVIFLLLWVIFRSLTAAALALAEVGIAIVWTLGLMRIFGLEVSLMTSLLPVLLAALGVADEIHLFAEFFRLQVLWPSRSRLRNALDAARNIRLPVTATTVTTALAFFSFLATDIPVLRVFGYFAGLGICFSWFLTLTFLPLVLGLVATGSGPSWVLSPPKRLLPCLARRRLPIVLTLAAVPGFFLLHVDDGWSRNFDPEHRIVRDLGWFERESAGLFRFDLALAARGKSAWPAGTRDFLSGQGAKLQESRNLRWDDPELLSSLAQLQGLIEGWPGVTTTLSVVDLIRDRAWELGDPAATRPPIPAAAPEVRRLFHTFRVFNEEVMLRQFVDRELANSRLMIFMEGDDYATATAVRSRLESAVRRAFGDQVAWVVAGSSERGRLLIGSLVSTQIRSVAAALLLSVFTLGLLTGRWTLSLRCGLAILWALLLLLGTVGWSATALGVATSCFLGLAIGIGLDYAIHLGFGYQPDRAVIGRRVLCNVFVVSAGLSVLLVSANPTIRALGGLLLLSMLVCGYTSVIVFPPPPEKR